VINERVVVVDGKTTPARQCIQALKNLETWLDKAEQHAAAKGFDVGVLLTSRLVTNQV
jgi:hypothetical protein